MEEYPFKEAILTHFLNVVGGKWKWLILYWLRSGPRRFTDLEKAIPGISRKVLTQQLQDLERLQMIRKTEIVCRPPKWVQYQMTPSAKALVPHIEGIAQWCETYYPTKKRLADILLP